MKNDLQYTMPYDDREALKRAGQRALTEGATLAERVIGAHSHLASLYARSLEHSRYHAEHPHFGDYVRMLEPADFGAGADVIAVLRSWHGAALVGVIPRGQSDWSPRPAAPRSPRHNNLS